MTSLQPPRRSCRRADVAESWRCRRRRRCCGCHGPGSCASSPAVAAGPCSFLWACVVGASARRRSGWGRRSKRKLSAAALVLFSQCRRHHYYGSLRSWRQALSRPLSLPFFGENILEAVEACWAQPTPKQLRGAHRLPCPIGVKITTITAIFHSPSFCDHGDRSPRGP